MRTPTVASLLCLAALLGGLASGELVDPTALIDALSQPSQPSKGLEKWTRPEWCGNSECPRYRLEKAYDDYEIRTYQSGTWAVTKVEGKYELAYTKATARLMKYWKGGNENSTSMDLTTPTLARLRPNKDVSKTERSYAFSWWLPEEYQKNTPRPTDDKIKLKDYRRTTVYVRAFGGFATEGTILENTRALHEDLDRDKQDFSTEEVFVAVYDPPQKLLNRHNEVHVVVSRRAEHGEAVPT